MKYSLQSDQRGVSHVLVVLLLVVVLVVVGFAGWRVLDKDKTDKDTVKTATSAADKDCLKVYDDTVLCDFATSNANFSSLAFTAINNSTDSMGQTTQTTIQNDGKSGTSLTAKAGNSTFNSIVIGPTTYVQNNGSPWVKYAHNAPVTASLTGNLKFNFSDPGTPKDQRVEYKKVGRERCGSADCYKYQVSGPAISGTTYIWINPDSDRLVRLTTKSSDGTNDITVTYGPVNITTPSPTITPTEASDATYESWMENARQNAQQ